MINALKSLFVYNVCYCCNNWLTSQEKCVCLTCQSQFPLTNFHLTPENNELYFRLAGRLPIKGAMSLYYFDKKGKLQQLIRNLKYHDSPDIGIYLGSVFGEQIKGCDWLSNIDLILPVPLHWRKKISRGYNQSEHLARGISEVLNIPYRSDVLIRTQFTQTQTRLSGNQRWENVKSAFKVKEKYTLPNGLLIIDDVITTGSTLEACIHPLIQQSNPDIYIASIGMARNG